MSDVRYQENQSCLGNNTENRMAAQIWQMSKTTVAETHNDSANLANVLVFADFNNCVSLFKCIFFAVTQGALLLSTRSMVPQ